MTSTKFQISTNVQMFKTDVSEFGALKIGIYLDLEIRDLEFNSGGGCYCG